MYSVPFVFKGTNDLAMEDHGMKEEDKDLECILPELGRLNLYNGKMGCLMYHFSMKIRVSRITRFRLSFQSASNSGILNTRVCLLNYRTIDITIPINIL